MNTLIFDLDGTLIDSSTSILAGFAAAFSVYALDKAKPTYTDKSHMLAEQLKSQQIPVDSAAYIGDRPEDGQAADANGLTFYTAEWGYSAFPPSNTPPHWITLTSPNTLGGSFPLHAGS